ncbi:MAG: 30S ribosomal protein S7 [Patescibacteria group bacterium]
MRRKKKVQRDSVPDVKYGNAILGKFINYVMKDGKKSTARRVVYDSFAFIEEKAKQDPLVVFDLAIKNLSPLVEIKSKRIGGATYQVPHEVRGERKLALAMRWLLTVSRAKTGAPMSKRLGEELILASKNEGSAMKKKMDTHRMAEANKAFAHFAR